jgi:hypothetical protein
MKGLAVEDTHHLHPNYLCVIIHGLVMLSQYDDGIDALIPNVGTSHAYRAGNWLAEIGFNPYDYQLRVQQVRPGHGAIDETRHTLIPAPVRRGLIEHECIVSISLPRPNINVVSYRTVELDPTLDLFGPDAPTVLQAVAQSTGYPHPSPIRVSNVHIFLYKVVPGTLPNVRLGDHPWAPDANPDLTSANLHIFASPETRPRIAHNMDEFHMATALLSNIDLHLRTVKPLPPYPGQDQIDRELGVRGLVVPEELEDLPSRNIRLADLGELRRQRQCLGKVWDPFEEFADPGSCTSPGGKG